jgi:membrane associated rhomboid family serine protease
VDGLEDRGGLNMQGTLLSIPARSRRQAMEWGLVLASQGIEAIIDRAGQGWELLVAERDYPRAQDTLAQYRVENRNWHWRQPLPEAGMIFHWGSLGWAAAIVAAYYWSAVRFPGLRSAGILDSDKVARGQWWRLLTAVTLHQNAPHLMANATTGFVLMGLAMARYGAGVALLATFLAGVAGNAADLLVYAQPHQSLGASGMIMGALGAITVQSFSFWRKARPGGRFLFRALAAGVLILVLVGFSPDSDVVAHVGGFIAGTLFGCALGWIRPARLQSGPANAGAILALAALLLAAWRLALRSP